MRRGIDRIRFYRYLNYDRRPAPEKEKESISLILFLVEDDYLEPTNYLIRINDPLNMN